MKGSKLTPKQKKFAQEYLKDFNATRAYREVYKTKTDNQASSNGARLVGNDKVQAYIRSVMQETKAKDILDINGVLDNLSRLATGEPRKKVFKRIDYKNPKKPKVEYNNVTTVTPEDQDQLKALELLGKYYKIFTDKVETETSISIDIGSDYDDASD